MKTLSTVKKTGYIDIEKIFCDKVRNLYRSRVMLVNLFFPVKSSEVFNLLKENYVPFHSLEILTSLLYLTIIKVPITDVD